MINTSKYFLICDPDANVRSVVKDVLLSFFSTAKVLESTDGADAADKAARQKFDLVVTETKLPKLSGLKLIESINALKGSVRSLDILVLSEEFTEKQFKELIPNVDFIQKPCGSQTLNDAIKLIFERQKKASSPNVELINPFIEGTALVLKTMATTEIKREKIFVRTGDQISGDISAVIAMNCSRFTGSFAIAFKKSTFLFFVNRMLGEQYKEVTAEICDAAGEICNQVFGHAKRILNEKGFDITPALPSVVVGDNHKIKHFSSGPVIAVQFSSEGGTFTIEASISRAK